jgi:hypothetical protein
VIPLSDVPAVEPLGETCWKRIENSVFAELDRQHGQGFVPEPRSRTSRSWALWRWRPALALAPVAAVVAVAAVAMLALFLLKGGDVSDGALEPSRIVTADSPVRMTLGRAAITVAPESALWIRSVEDRGVEVMLEDGRVECAVAPQRDRPPFVVQAGDVRVEVVGTRFAVERHGADVKVHVSKGVVTVYHDGERLEVGAGRSWPAVTGAAGASDSADGVYESRDAGQAASRRGANRSAGAGSRIEADKVRAASQARAKELYERAASLEASQPDQARALYQEVIERGGPWAANALFAQARLELDLGHRERASALLSTYLQRFPEGANAADARELLDQR